MNVKVTRKSHVKVLGRWVRVPNFLIRERWSDEKISFKELRAQEIGDLQSFVMKSPLFPFVVVMGFFAVMIFASWAVPALVDALL